MPRIIRVNGEDVYDGASDDGDDPDLYIYADLPLPWIQQLPEVLRREVREIALRVIQIRQSQKGFQVPPLVWDENLNAADKAYIYNYIAFRSVELGLVLNAAFININ